METTATQFTPERLATLRAQALCGNPLALDLLLAHREDEATRRLCENIRNELDAWEAVRRPRTEAEESIDRDRARLDREDELRRDHEDRKADNWRSGSYARSLGMGEE